MDLCRHGSGTFHDQVSALQFFYAFAVTFSAGQIEYDVEMTVNHVGVELD